MSRLENVTCPQGFRVSAMIMARVGMGRKSHCVIAARTCRLVCVATDTVWCERECCAGELARSYVPVIANRLMMQCITIIKASAGPLAGTALT